MVDSDERVLIVGAGIGGLTLAYGLRRAGVHAEVFEQASELDSIARGGGLMLWHNAMRAFAQVGLAQTVADAGSEIRATEFRSWRGDVLARWPVGEMARELGHPTVGVSRRDLHSALTGALDPDALHLGAALVGYEQDAGGVRAHFADGRCEQGAVLVGTDGMDSAVRRQLLGAAQPRYAGYTVWTAVIDFPEGKTAAHVFRICWGPGSRFAYYQVRGDQLYWFAVRNAPEGGVDGAEGAKDGLLEYFGGWDENVRDIIAATPTAAIRRLDMRDRKPVRRWGDGRVTLLGDAAHPMTFNLGQGACQAAEGAALLTRLLTAGNGAEPMLREYEQRRMARTAAFTRQSRNLGAMGRWSHPLAVAGRERMMRFVLNGPALHKHRKNAAYAF